LCAKGLKKQHGVGGRERSIHLCAKKKRGGVTSLREEEKEGTSLVIQKGKRVICARKLKIFNVYRRKRERITSL